MEGAPAKKEQLPLDLVLRAIGECAQLGIATLYVTGGEPLLYPGLEKALRLASGIPKLEVTVCTNAMLLQERHASLLRDVGAKVNVSVDGDEEFHDQFRNQRGSFRLMERGLRRVVEAGIPVTIVSTISRANLHLLPWLVRWAASAGAAQFRAQPLLNLGRGTEISDQRLSNHEMNRLLLQLTDLANVYRARGLKCNLVGASRSFLLKHPCGAYVCNGAGCHRRVAQEIKKLVIREDGTVLPEVTNLSHEFAIGRIEDGLLSEMVNQYFQDGYQRFDRLCRSTYAEVLPQWDSEFIPWDEIVAERSRRQRDVPLVRITAAGCGSCGEAVADECAVA
jgi:Fe-coproporphyrin III synthase